MENISQTCDVVKPLRLYRMVAGVFNHLKALRRMKDDGGWIKDLLMKYNERMHFDDFLWPLPSRPL